MAMTTRFLLNAQQELETKNSDLLLAKEHINSSLRMAGLLQVALLPDPDAVGKYFKNCIFSVMPKASIGGDFIFIMKRSEDVLFGSFDCTGHGIPAAILATSAYFILKDLAYKHTTPGTILTNMNRTIYNAFRNDFQNIAQLEGVLCSYSESSGRVVYASAHGKGFVLGAHGAAALAKNNAGIGQDLANTFEDRELSSTFPLRLLLFSDGLVDQFGGSHDKKYTTKRLSAFLSTGAHRSLQELNGALQREFQAWKGDTPQTDDVSYMLIEL